MSLRVMIAFSAPFATSLDSPEVQKAAATDDNIVNAAQRNFGAEESLPAKWFKYRYVVMSPDPCFRIDQIPCWMLK